jgi:TolB-like protein
MRGRFISAFLFAAVVGAAAAAPTPPSLYPDKDIDAGLGKVNDLAFSNDGRLLAAAGQKGWGVWDAQSGNSIRKDAAISNAARVAFGGQGTYLAVGDESGKVVVVDLRSGTPRDVAKHGKAITAVAFSADGKIGASGDAGGNINVWDPERGPIGPLNDGGHKDAILVLSFAPNGTLTSASKDLRVVTWDVAGKRPQRRATLQSEVSGRTIVPSSGASDGEATKVVVGAQMISTPRGGVLAGGGNLARPEDLRRDNVVLPYVIATGVSADPVKTGDYQAERIALSPSGCYAFFTSNYRSQTRLHIWGLIEAGDDLTRTDLSAKASALALEPGAHEAAVAFETGKLQTFRVSGATTADCDQYAKKNAPQTSGPQITMGPETEPLIKGGEGYRIAVLRFEATGVDPGLGDAVAEMVTGELSNNKNLIVIERGAINSILKEMEIQRSGLTAADAVKIGKGLNAKKVLFGSVRRFGDSTYITTARVVDVETQQIEGSREVTCENCKEQDLPRAVSQLRRVIAP